MELFFSLVRFLYVYISIVPFLLCTTIKNNADTRVRVRDRFRKRWKITSGYLLPMSSTLLFFSSFFVQCMLFSLSLSASVVYPCLFIQTTITTSSFIYIYLSIHVCLIRLLSTSRIFNVSTREHNNKQGI